MAQRLKDLIPVILPASAQPAPAEPEPQHFSADNYPVTVGAKFWDNDLRIVTITELGTRGQAYADTGEISTWHRHTGGSSDTLTGAMRPYGRLARCFEGRDAQDYADGTRFGDIR